MDHRYQLIRFQTLRHYCRHLASNVYHHPNYNRHLLAPNHYFAASIPSFMKKKVHSKPSTQFHHPICRLVFDVQEVLSRLTDIDAFRRHDEGMSASSGSKGVCGVCGHANNEHNSYTCEARGCRKKFKVCQTGSHQDARNGTYVLCKGCPDHPYECSMFDAQNIQRLF